MWVIALFVTNWFVAVFFQSSFHHRYASHRMFTMSEAMERVFHVGTWLTQGSSYLSPRAYAILHREHHAFSDTERDPHAPAFFSNVLAMMWKTGERYTAHFKGTSAPEARFLGNYPEWPTLEKIASSWTSRIAWGTVITLLYIWLATAWWQFLLLPIHYLMGPIHGAIVNWCGHKYGYRNFDTTRDDKSKNTLVFDFVTLGELFQNNHHKFGMSPNFAARWFEIDPTYWVLRAMAACRLIRMQTA